MNAPITLRVWARVSDCSRQTQRSFSLENQDSMNAAVAVAALTAVSDPVVAQAGAKRAGRVGRRAVGAQGQAADGDAALGGRCVEHRLRSWARQRTSIALPVICLLQQWMAALR